MSLQNQGDPGDGCGEVDGPHPDVCWGWSGSWSLIPTASSGERVGLGVGRAAGCQFRVGHAASGLKGQGGQESGPLGHRLDGAP